MPRPSIEPDEMDFPGKIRMMPGVLKRILKTGGIALLLALLAGGGFAGYQIRAHNQSMAKVYNVPIPVIDRSTDPAVIERGRHLATSLGGCVSCHGENLGGGKIEKMGPLGTFKMPNISSGKNGVEYSDGELARLIQHGIRKDGTSVRFMPSMDFAWWPKEDVRAVISWLRSRPPVDGEPASAEIGALGKILDRLDLVPLDVARRIPHDSMPVAPAPAPNAAYGAYLAKLCMGCHGAGLSGGRIPGAPPELPIPLNLTPHETGLKGWELADFERLMRNGIRKNGKQLDPFMPIDSTRNFDDTEVRAVWAYLQTLPPTELGKR